jgi:hypothetical protein
LNLITQLSEDEERSIRACMERMMFVQGPNREADLRYSGEWLTRQFGISIPPNMRNLRTVAGWCGTVVDVLEERLDWLGWSTVDSDDSLGLQEVYDQNELDVDSGMAHLDSMIFGVSFVTVGTGLEGEPSPLITPHSPRTVTGTWSRRTRRLDAAVAADMKMGRTVSITLYTPDETVTVDTTGPWKVIERDDHKLGRVPVVMVPNRVRGSRETGRSEITKPVRYYADAAARTLLGLEVNREFYNAPQRIGLNVSDDMFVDASGNQVSPWTSIMGRTWNIPPGEEGSAPPDVKQFPPSSPAPYIDQVKGYATLLAAEAGIPGSYLGFMTDNPASADAIRAGEARLVKRAERRQLSFGRAWHEVGRLALLIRDGALPDDYDTRVSERWRDAATPTRAASADEAAKLIGAGVLPADSTVTYDRVGLSPDEQAKVKADKARAQALQLTANVAAAAGAAVADPAMRSTNAPVGG